jgi:hypothetical protein
MASVGAYLRGNVLGLVAIFLALTGGAYAVTHKRVTNSELATGSVDTRTLASGAVAGPDIHSAAVGPKKLKLEKLVKYLQTRVNGECPQGQTVQGILADGSVLCVEEGAGTITGVTTSGGLTGGGTSGNVALGTDPTVLQSRVNDDCTGTDAVQAINQDGSVDCQATGTGTVTSVGSGFGLTGGPITGSGTIAADPAVMQRRIVGECINNTAIQSIGGAGTVGCSANFDVTENSGAVTLNPGDPPATLVNFGGVIIRATCTAAGRAIVEVGSNAGAGQFLNYQSRTTSSGMIGASVNDGNFATIMDTATNDLGQVNIITSQFRQVDGSFFGWATDPPTRTTCRFDGSALTF